MYLGFAFVVVLAAKEPECYRSPTARTNSVIQTGFPTMKLKFVMFVLASVVFGVFTARADTFTYTYSGAPMISAQGAISAGNCATCSISGSFQIDIALTPTPDLLNKSETIIPLSFSFTATGLDTFTQNNSTFTMFAAVQPSLDIYAFGFTITGTPGMISSNFYGSAFEFTDFYSGPGVDPMVYAEGNYKSGLWTYSKQVPEPPAWAMTLVAVGMLAIARRKS